MSPSFQQLFYQFLILTIIVTLSTARPQGAIDNNQETMDNQPSIADLEKFYSSYRFPNYVGVEEPNPLERLQMQYRANPLYSNNMFSAAGPAGLWDPLRQLVNKRQTRYRQCYFNPISCFKK